MNLATLFSATARAAGRSVPAALAASIALGAAPAASAQDYPTRPIKLVVPFAPGGTTDVVARPLAAKLGEELGQQVVIDNRGGAGGSIGADIVAKAAPDGYTLLLFHVGMLYGTALYPSLPYDVVKDFAPISLAGIAPSVLIVNPKLAAKNLAEFTAYAKAHPGELNYGSAGAGTSGHLAVEYYQTLAGVKVTHVPYKGGAPAAAAVMAGDIQFMIETLGSVVPNIKAGNLRALAVTSEARARSLPEVPTMREAGLNDYVYTTWYGMWAPGRTPPAIVNRLNAAMVKVLNRDDVKATLDSAGVDATTTTPARFAEIIAADLKTWGGIIRKANIKVQ